MQDPFTIAAILVGCPRDNIIHTVIREDGSLIAITTTGSKYTFTKLLVDSASLPTDANHTPPVATPASSPPAPQGAPETDLRAVSLPARRSHHRKR